MTFDKILKEYYVVVGVLGGLTAAYLLREAGITHQAVGVPITGPNTQGNGGSTSSQTQQRGSQGQGGSSSQKDSGSSSRPSGCGPGTDNSTCSKSSSSSPLISPGPNVAFQKSSSSSSPTPTSFTPPALTIPQSPSQQQPTSTRPPKNLAGSNTHVQQFQQGGPNIPGGGLPQGGPSPPPRQQPPTPPIQHPPFHQPIPMSQRPPGDFDRRFPVRTFEHFPDRFRDFDHRFDDDRRRFDVDDFREEFDDDDDRRFRPFIERFRFRGDIDIDLIEFILGLDFIDSDDVLGVDVPIGPGIWVIAVNGRWFKVRQAELNLIRQIEDLRGIDHHLPIII